MNTLSTTITPILARPSTLDGGHRARSWLAAMQADPPTVGELAQTSIDIEGQSCDIAAMIVAALAPAYEGKVELASLLAIYANGCASQAQLRTLQSGQTDKVQKSPKVHKAIQTSDDFLAAHFAAIACGEMLSDIWNMLASISSRDTKEAALAKIEQLRHKILPTEIRDEFSRLRESEAACQSMILDLKDMGATDIVRESDNRISWKVSLDILSNFSKTALANIGIEPRLGDTNLISLDGDEVIAKMVGSIISTSAEEQI